MSTLVRDVLPTPAGDPAVLDHPKLSWRRTRETLSALWTARLAGKVATTNREQTILQTLETRWRRAPVIIYRNIARGPCLEDYLSSLKRYVHAAFSKQSAQQQQFVDAASTLYTAVLRQVHSAVCMLRMWHNTKTRTLSCETRFHVLLSLTPRES